MKDKKGFQRGIDNWSSQPWLGMAEREAKHRDTIRRNKLIGQRTGFVAHGESNLAGMLNDEGKKALRCRELGLSIRATARVLGWSYGSTQRFFARHRHPRSGA